MLVSGRVAEGEEAVFENDDEDLGDFEMHEQIDQWVLYDWFFIFDDLIEFCEVDIVSENVFLVQEHILTQHQLYGNISLNSIGLYVKCFKFLSWHVWAIL